MEKRFLITRWLGSDPQRFAIYDEASVSSVRQRIRELGRNLSLNREFVESVALIASELAHNQLSHAKQGYCAVHPVERDGVKGLEVIAADIGSGIEKPDLAIKDGISAIGSLGAGLGAVCRMADEVEFDNRITEGLRVVARKFEAAVAPRYCELAMMGRPYPGEIISGDDAVFFQSESELLAGVFDGLGHGPQARKASNQAVDVLSRMGEAALDQILIDLDRELAGTRGCALCIVRFRKSDKMLECASIGDVHSHLYNLRNAHFFTATPLVLGSGQLRKQTIRIETAPVEPGSTLVMFTDGLKSRTSLKGQLDILRQPAIAIAQHLIEKDSRPDDDALVLVGRFAK